MKKHLKHIVEKHPRLPILSLVLLCVLSLAAFGIPQVSTGQNRSGNTETQVSGYPFAVHDEDFNQLYTSQSETTPAQHRTHNGIQYFITNERGTYRITNPDFTISDMQPGTKREFAGKIDAKTGETTLLGRSKVSESKGSFSGRNKGTGTVKSGDAAQEYRLGLILINTDPSGPLSASPELLRPIIETHLRTTYQHQSYNKMNVSIPYTTPWLSSTNKAALCPSVPNYDQYDQALRAALLSSADTSNAQWINDVDGILTYIDCTGYNNSNPWGFSSIGPRAFYFDGQTHLISVSDVKFNKNTISSKSAFTGTPNHLAVAEHELGHAFGLNHAQGKNCHPAVLTTSGCTIVGYGNSFDVMGNFLHSRHINGHAKSELGWLTSSEAVNITQSGTYSVSSLEIPDSAYPHKIAYVYDQTDPSKKLFMIEYRNPDAVRPDTSYAPTASNPDWGILHNDLKKNTEGIFIYQIDSEGYPAAILLDAQPVALTGQPNNRHVSLLRSGQNPWFSDPSLPQSGPSINLTPQTPSFTDPATGITIGPVTRASGDARRAEFTVTYPSFDACTDDAVVVSNVKLNSAANISAFKTLARLSVTLRNPNTLSYCDPLTVTISNLRFTSINQGIPQVFTPIAPVTLEPGQEIVMPARVNIHQASILTPGTTYDTATSLIQHGTGETTIHNAPVSY